MARYIDKDELLETIENHTMFEKYGLAGAFLRGDVIELIHLTPSVDVAELKHGERR